MANGANGGNGAQTASESSGRTLNVEQAVRERYSGASKQAEQALCCPVNYDTQYLEILPDELIERDYGCGNPSAYVREGDVVLDLGSGGGKICYIASQIVGPKGRVIGVDMNDDMLDLARRFQNQIGDAIGWRNTEFRKGKIQDLALDLDQFAHYLATHQIDSPEAWLEAESHASHLRSDQPMIPDETVDVVISNCVLNLVSPDDRRRMFAEIYRVLNRGGRAAISDIVSDEPAPDRLRNDPELWSGCISGAFVESEFLQAFEDAGFHGVAIVERQAEPWAVVEGIEFRSVTVQAYKGKEGPCLERNQAVIYRGPWKAVIDDDGHRLERGVRTAVCDKTFHLYQRPPYDGQLIPITPVVEIPIEDAPAFDCRRTAVRDPQETKSGRPALTQLPGSDCCGPDCC